jgi:outer membrane lipoprotein carrier protein
MFRIATSTTRAALIMAAIVAACLPPAVPRAQSQTEALTQQGLNQDSRTPERLAQALQERYQGIRDFSANFVHTYRGGVLRTQTSERGRVVVKKPGQMRWVYTAPEPKEFVSDGLRMYAYLPEDRQVMVTTLMPDEQATTPAAFLAGRGDIVRDFSAAFDETTFPGETALKLTPHRAEPEYEYLVVAMNPTSLQILALSTRDRQGGDSTLSFTDLKENQGVADKEFVFRIPPGVDVITDGTAR